jgi:hypothetical protein
VGRVFGDPGVRLDGKQAKTVMLCREHCQARDVHKRRTNLCDPEGLDSQGINYAVLVAHDPSTLIASNVATSVQLLKATRGRDAPE